MAYRLRITDLALADLDAILGALRRGPAAGVASEWLGGFERAVASLAESSVGEPAPEAADVDFAPRQISYRAHRVLFGIGLGFGEATIDVLRVYPGAGQSLTLNLLRGPESRA